MTGDAVLTEVQLIPWKVLKQKWPFRNAPSRGKGLNIFLPLWSWDMSYPLSSRGTSKRQLPWLRQFLRKTAVWMVPTASKQVGKEAKGISALGFSLKGWKGCIWVARHSIHCRDALQNVLAASSTLMISFCGWSCCLTTSAESSGVNLKMLLSSSYSLTELIASTIKVQPSRPT